MSSARWAPVNCSSSRSHSSSGSEVPLAEAAETSDPDELCDRLLRDLTGAHRADDIALLALTRLA